MYSISINKITQKQTYIMKHRHIEIWISIYNNSQLWKELRSLQFYFFVFAFFNAIDFLM
jgi:hypothetical protein